MHDGRSFLGKAIAGRVVGVNVFCRISIVAGTMVNKTNQHIQVLHKGVMHRVDIAMSEEELAQVAAFDHQQFLEHQSITRDELRAIKENGRVLMLRDEHGALIAEAQIVLHDILALTKGLPSGAAFSYGTAVDPASRGSGAAQIIYKAQEVTAREAGKNKIRLTVRVENARSIRARLKAGFRITDYHPHWYEAEHGARLIMEKDLINEPLPFELNLQGTRIDQDAIPIIQNINPPSDYQPSMVAVAAQDDDSHKGNGPIHEPTHRLIEQLLTVGYVGIGLLKPEPSECQKSTALTRPLIVFQRKDTVPPGDQLTLPVQVTSEYGRLEEVIVSLVPENAQIRKGTNKVSAQHRGHIDSIAFKDEYQAFVDALTASGVRTVRTKTLGKNGSVAIFTRDPAFVIEDTFVMGHMLRHRAEETNGMRRIKTACLRRVLNGDEAATLEGGDVVYIGPQHVAVGLGHRTNKAGLRNLKAAFPAIHFIGVEHDELHLDVLFTVVGEKHALADVTRLPKTFLETLSKEGYTLIEADPREQETLGCNVLTLNNKVVLAVKENVHTNQRLRQYGIEVIEVSMPNIIKKGGGPRCMTCPTHRKAANT